MIQYVSIYNVFGCGFVAWKRLSGGLLTAFQLSPQTERLQQAGQSFYKTKYEESLQQLQHQREVLCRLEEEHKAVEQSVAVRMCDAHG